MSMNFGIVLDNSDDGFAKVKINRSGACGGCDSSSGHCHGCLTNSEMISRVANPIHAGPGEIVRVELDSREVFKGAAVLYILPVLTILAGAFSGMGIETHIGLSAGAGSILFSLIGLLLGLLMVKFFDRSDWALRKLSPTITSVVSSRLNGRRSVSS